MRLLPSARMISTEARCATVSFAISPDGPYPTVEHTRTSLSYRANEGRVEVGYDLSWKDGNRRGEDCRKSLFADSKNRTDAMKIYVRSKSARNRIHVQLGLSAVREWTRFRLPV